MFFTPFKLDGVDLIDGGVLNPVPIAPTFSDDTDYTVAVNLGGTIKNQIDKPVATSDSATKQSSSQGKISQFIDQLKQSAVKSSGHDWGVYDVANQAFDAMQSTIARQKLAAYPPDKIIEIARNACGTLEFDRADEMISMGYTKAQENLSQLI